MTIKLILKVCSVAALVLLAFIALGPAAWTPRSGLGGGVDHFVGYFVFTLMFCLAWPRPLVVAGALVAYAALLEAPQAITSDRHSNLFAALYSAAGVLAAALLADLFIRASRWLNGRTLLMPQRLRAAPAIARAGHLGITHVRG
jgi:hypothetical protein